MNKEDTLILFGRSPFINEIKKYIPRIIKKWHTMGCNTFCESFPDVEYVIFYDDICPKVGENSTIITDNLNYVNEHRKAYSLLHNHPKVETWKVIKMRNRFAEEDDELSLCVHTPSMALDWAYKKGFKNVVLAGIDLIPNTKHFDSEAYIFNNEAVKTARLHLTGVATRYLNIYQLNSRSDLLPKVGLEELI